MDFQGLPDPVWSNIQAASGLPDEAREKVTAAIRGYERLQSKAAGGETRKRIKRAIRTAEELEEELQKLDQDEFFRTFGAKEPPDLAYISKARKQLGALSHSLRNDQTRFKKRGRSRSMMVPGALATDLLEIRTSFLGVDVPTSLGETTNTGRFRQYVETCLLFFDSSLTTEEIKDAIDVACEGFKERQPFEPENFPKSERRAVK
ncbi:hypothetical protein ABIF07_005462 [Bradyrhizobium elkanii]|uniref:hypothetical protein n=1 Tax=Bradyrhizobium elkanii TaxID=29448 RepID=UPI00216A7FDD|nr:hypothetical protein [Bradyrhizobium elkanii]MCS3687511.1 hypothetical protein [Bradyrhizobium elkanii]